MQGYCNFPVFVTSFFSPILFRLKLASSDYFNTKKRKTGKHKNEPTLTLLMDLTCFRCRLSLFFSKMYYIIFYHKGLIYLAHSRSSSKNHGQLRRQDKKIKAYACAYILVKWASFFEGVKSWDSFYFSLFEVTNLLFRLEKTEPRLIGWEI